MNNPFKKSLIILVMLLVQNSHAQTTLSWCAYYNWTPWIYPTDTSYAGILMEQLNLFEKQHHMKAVAVVRENWKRCQVDVENGHINMILGANKTPLRSEIFYYLSKPSFVNKSNINAYGLAHNTTILKVKNLEDLATFKLALDRGNSYGSKIDQFIHNLPKESRRTSNTMGDVFKMIIAKRKDYFFSPDASLKSSIDKYSLKIPALRITRFKKILSVERKIAVFLAFTKKGDVYKKMSQLWIETLNDYYNNVDIDERIQYHTKNALKFEKAKSDQ